VNWLERARREIDEICDLLTANTAKRNPTAVSAVRVRAISADDTPSFGSNGSVGPSGLDCLLEDFEERAAIMEYEGGLPRREAELLASKSVTCDITSDLSYSEVQGEPQEPI